MEVKVEKVTGWKYALDAARITANQEPLNNGKEPSDKFKHSVLAAEHSPIREVVFTIDLYDVPGETMGCLVRHHIGCEKFVATLRDDRTEVNQEDVTYATPRRMRITANAQSLINISRKRLCRKAHKDALLAWRAVKGEVAKIDPIMAHYMVPECIYRGFCPEGCSCGFAQTAQYRFELKDYHREK